MPNKNPATRIVNYPAKFKPLLDKELEEKGIFSYTELMGRILAEHYGIRPQNNTIIEEKSTKDEGTIIKGRKLDG